MITRRLSSSAITIVLAAAVLSPLSVGAATAAPLAPASSSSTAAAARGPLVAKTFANCTELNKKYKHGVGTKKAKDKVSGKTKPVTNFAKDDKVYNQNKKMDRDKDGVACEKR